MAPRPLRPKPSVTTAPLVVTDQNCMAIVGLDGRQLRALVSGLSIPHTTRGHRVLVRADALLEALARAESETRAHESGSAEPVDGDEPATADAVLRALGLRRSA